MSYSLSIKPFNKLRNNEAWDKIISGEFLDELRTKIPDSQKESSPYVYARKSDEEYLLDKIEKFFALIGSEGRKDWLLSEYTTWDDFYEELHDEVLLRYRDNKSAMNGTINFLEAFKTKREMEKLHPQYVLWDVFYADLKSEALAFQSDLETTSTNFIEVVNDLQLSIDNHKKQKWIDECIIGIDDLIADYYAEEQYNDSISPFDPFFAELIQIVLDVDFYEKYKGSYLLLPIEKWIELFRNVTADAVKKAIDRVGDDPDDVDCQETYTDILKEIRNIVKVCIDTKSELLIHDELYDQDDDFNTLEVRNADRIKWIRARLEEKGIEL